jgi:nitroreductase
MSSYNDRLFWRYATKKFDPTKHLTQEQLDELLESARLSASSYGLQPYKLVVVTNPAIRAKLREHAWNQSQVTDASHLVVICSYRTIDAAYIDRFVGIIASERGVSVESLKGYRDMMVGSIQGRTPEQLADWMKRQSYIALGFLLSAAAQHQIDACPMEGFDATHVDVDLGLAEENLTAAVFCPLGFRASDDATASYKKVRFPKEEFIVFKD